MMIPFRGSKNKWLLAGLVIPSSFVIRASSFQLAYATPQHAASTFRFKKNNRAQGEQRFFP
jgi:hypothetical protein